MKRSNIITYQILSLFCCLSIFIAFNTTVSASIKVPLDFKTIQGAIDASIDGDTIEVATGKYKETLKIHGRSLTIKGNGDSATTLDGRNSNQSPTILIENSKIELTGFTIKNGIIGISVLNSEDIKISDITVNGSKRFGIFVKNSTVNITNSLIKDTQRFQGKDGNGIEIEDCKIVVSGISVENSAYTGFSVLNSSGGITQSQFINNNTWGLSAELCTDMDISSNLVDNNGLLESIGHGTLLLNCETSHVNNNTFSNNNDGGLIIANSSSIEISNNHIIGNDAFGIGLVSADKVTIIDNRIENTIIADSFGFSGVLGHGIEIVESSVSIEGNNINFNEENGINVTDSVSIVEIINNRVTDNDGIGITCSFSDSLTGCCNIVTDNNADNLAGCQNSLTLCPCPDGDTDDIVSIEPSAVLLTRIGSKAQLAVILESLENGTILNITDKSNWSSLNESVATINTQGLVTATGEGETEICAEFQDIKGCIPVTVDITHSGINQWTASPESEEVLSITRSVAIDPVNTDIIYATIVSGKVFKSLDRGETWLDKSKGITDRGLFSVRIVPENSQTLYVGGSQSINKSVNGAETWSVVKNNVSVTSLRIDPFNSKIVYAGTNGDGVLKTVNGGTSWNSVNKGLKFKNVREDSFVIDPGNSRILYIAVEADDAVGKGVYKSTNGGLSWAEINNGLFKEVQGLAIDPVDSKTIYAGTFNKGVFKSIDGGRQWFELPNSPHEQNRVITIDNRDNRVIYVGNQGNGVFMSRDAGQSWIRFNSRLTSQTVRAIEIDPSNSSVIYAGTLSGVARYTHAFDKMVATPDLDGTSVDLSYKFNRDAGINATGFNIYRSTSQNGDYKKITNKPVNPDSVEFTDNDFLEGGTHVYKMTAINEDGETLKGFTASAKPLLISNPDFTLEAVEFEKDVTTGNNAVFPLNIASRDNFPKEVFLTASNIPSGVTVEFTPQSGVPPFAGKLNVVANSEVLPGEYEINLIASSDEKKRSSKVKLHLVAGDSIKSVLTQVINATNVKVGDSAEITGSLFPAKEGDEITVTFTSPEGTVNNETAILDKESRYSVIKTLDKSGLWSIKSSWPGDEKFPATATQIQELVVDQTVTTIFITTDVSQDTKQGDLLTMSGKVVPAPGNGRVLLVIDNIDGSLNFNSFISLSENGDFSHKFKVAGGDKGQIRIKARFDGNQDFSSSEKEIIVPVQEPTGMAIIVAGGGISQENKIRNAINSLCNYAFTVIKNLGIPDQPLKDDKNSRIFYLHPDPSNDADKDGIADTDAMPSLANLKNAIEEWAANLVDTGTINSPLKTPLIIYLTGPGDIDSFKINDTETLTANELDTWLDNLFNTVKNKMPDGQLNSLPVNIILESPQSGSFIDDLAVNSDGIGNGRIVITSTNACDPDDSNCETGKINIDGEGAISFSKQFFFGIKIGKSPGTAWAEANLVIRQLFDNQRPQLNGNLNNIANEIDDELAGSNVFINHNRSPNRDDNDNTFKIIQEEENQNVNSQSFIIDRKPVIKGVQKNLVLKESSAASVWVVADDPDNNLDNVQALVYPPKSNTPEILQLEFSDGNNRFEQNYKDFTLFGLYKIIFAAGDKFGNASLAATTFVNSQNIIPAIIKGTVVNSNNKRPIKGAGLQIQGISLFTETGDNGEYFLQLPAGVYTLTAIKDGFSGFSIKDLLIASLELPNVQNFELEPIGNVTGKASIHGTVTNINGDHLSRVKMNLKGTGIDHDTLTDKDGQYEFTGLMKGTYNISAQKRGFEVFEKDGIEVESGESVTMDVLLKERE